jgi:hypothetical protein
MNGPGIENSGFGGLGVSMLASGTQDHGFAPDRTTIDNIPEVLLEWYISGKKHLIIIF